MPYYDYKCKSCEFVEINRRASVNDTEVSCPKCQGTMVRLMHSQFGINMGASGAYGYYDDNLETYINGNQHRREVMKQKGVTEKIGKGWK